jgi:hypothetical protein
MPEENRRYVTRGVFQHSKEIRVGACGTNTFELLGVECMSVYAI